MYINLHYKCTRFHEMREMNISFLSLVGAFSIPTHRFLVWPIRSAIILLTMHIESPGLIGSGGCAVFYTISRFQNSVFSRKETHRSSLENRFLTPNSVYQICTWNLFHCPVSIYQIDSGDRSTKSKPKTKTCGLCGQTQNQTFEPLTFRSWKVADKAHPPQQNQTSK